MIVKEQMGDEAARSWGEGYGQMVTWPEMWDMVRELLGPGPETEERIAALKLARGRRLLALMDARRAACEKENEQRRQAWWRRLGRWLGG